MKLSDLKDFLDSVDEAFVDPNVAEVSFTWKKIHVQQGNVTMMLEDDDEKEN